MINHSLGAGRTKSNERTAIAGRRSFRNSLLVPARSAQRTNSRAIVRGPVPHTKKRTPYREMAPTVFGVFRRTRAGLAFDSV